MKKYVCLIVPLAFLWLAVGSGCKKKDPCSLMANAEPRYENFIFYLVDKNTNENLVGFSNNRYRPDSIRVITGICPNCFNQSANYSLDAYGKYRCLSILESAESIYFLRLNKNDTDTLTVKANTSPDAICKLVVDFYHNNQLILTHDYSSGDIPELKLKK